MTPSPPGTYPLRPGVLRLVQETMVIQASEIFMDIQNATPGTPERRLVLYQKWPGESPCQEM